MFYWNSYEEAMLFSQHKYPSLWGGSLAFLAGQVPQSSVCSLPLPSQPQHFCSCSPATAEPSAEHPQPSLLLLQCQRQQQQLCRQVRRDGFPLAFYSTFTFALLLCCWCSISPSPSDHPLLLESHRLEHLMRPFKIQGLILRQSKSEKKFFTCNYFPWPELHSAEQRGQHMASFWGKCCSCPLHSLKVLSTQAAQGVLALLSIMMPILKTGNLQPMGLPTATQIV